ncbi:hypothetical protein QFZ41_002583 [Luteibacter sp. W1I16]|uniref:hypothetical protein n=1 Tax=Luteibacter sp. W1I16 TaxID=3373922 RepID=UPI003D22A8CC
MNATGTRLINPMEMRAQIASDLGIRSRVASTDMILAQSLRRLCGLMCPVPRELVIECAIQSLDVALEVTQPQLKELVHETIEALIVAGDLVEVTDDPTNGKIHTALYLCAPRFMPLGDRHYLLGVASDDAVLLPEDISSALIHEGAVRYLPSATAATVVERLRLPEINYKDWTRKFSYGSAEDLRSDIEERLRIRGTVGDPGDIRLLSHAGGQAKYKERWRSPADESGYHVFRVERTYGAAAWFVGLFSAGRCTRYLAIDPLEVGGRACDAAWLIQLAVDATNGRPNTYTLEADGCRTVIRPGFPLPTQAHRQLIVLSGRIPSDVSPQGVLSFSSGTVNEAEAFLQESCWFVRL